MAAITLERTITCRADSCSLWDVLTDTERLNRAIGNNKLEVSAFSDGTPARFVARTRISGFDLEYEERPFEWVYPQRFEILRRMRNGPIKFFDLKLAFKPQPDGTTALAVTLKLDPRYGFLAPVVRVAAGQVMGRLVAEAARLDGAIMSGAMPPTARKSPTERPALLRAAALLKAVDDTPLAAKLVDFVDTGGDLEISRIRPFELADEWKVDRHELLSTCLRAVKAGLLDLRWDIICPSCRTVSTSIPSLDKLSEHGGCQLCEITFDLNLDEAVEATFCPAKSVRQVDEGPYCIGGPARTPHVVAQQILEPGQSLPLTAPLETGRFRLFLRGGAARPVEISEGAPLKVAVSLSDESPDPLPLMLGPGGEIVVTNAASTGRHAKLERLEWLSKAASARVVTSLAAFRRDFASDVLRPGSSLKVSRMGLFFSDLTDSTKLYSTTGDAAAFKVVQDHFDVVIPLIEKHHGTLVKTIGDAVMAVFADDMDGLRACLALQPAFEAFRQSHADGLRTDIKLGFYSGPCFALTANKVLDYFGQTVNIAARLQAQAHSGELVIESLFADQAIAEGVLQPAQVRERFTAELKGVDRTFEMARIGPPVR